LSAVGSTTNTASSPLATPASASTNTILTPTEPVAVLIPVELLPRPAAAPSPATSAPDAALIPAERVCSSCEKSLPRSLFPKKEFLKSGGVCASCKKRERAKIVGQTPPKVKLQGRVAESGQTRRPNNFGYCDYIDKLFSMKCFTDIMKLGVFSSAKDVSESMSGGHNAMHYRPYFPLSDLFCYLLQVPHTIIHCSLFCPSEITNSNTSRKAPWEYHMFKCRCSLYLYR
jgi:hypothetical protein